MPGTLVVLAAGGRSQGPPGGTELKADPSMASLLLGLNTSLMTLSCKCCPQLHYISEWCFFFFFFIRMVLTRKITFFFTSP